ncbi:inner membrane protein Cox18 [Schizosaccharomyces japonicus yFS275]|uniref:Inner membrane protein Cox18 n=1 Tax=Schizosaccharomyces japonicus (strain yFS275 / FY16936) TaxID=402676 RepID=B6K4C1_SCHJY|nr:inner membrane protein Cox18 [Schizosaccharomyces japonicus yFS275]EEB08328.1 inner membrane protein Cox18 [Schizosaccharomyces japonicus yFS275]
MSFPFSEIHSFLPWSVGIPAFAICLRTCITLPIAIASKRRRERLLQIHSLLTSKRNQLVSKDAIKQEKRRLYSEFRCSPWPLLLLPMAQIPCFAYATLKLRRLVRMAPSSMTTEGAFWFQNLLEPDPTGLLTVSLGLAYMTNAAIVHRRQQFSGLSKGTFIASILSSFAMIYVASLSPSAMTLYWSTSALYSTIQNALLYRNDTPSEPAKDK